MPLHVAPPGTLGRLVDITRDYARVAASETTLKAYMKDEMRIPHAGEGAAGQSTCPVQEAVGQDPADLAAPKDKAVAAAPPRTGSATNMPAA